MSQLPNDFSNRQTQQVSDCGCRSDQSQEACNDSQMSNQRKLVGLIACLSQVELELCPVDQPQVEQTLENPI
jgi:hypothetical protein